MRRAVCLVRLRFALCVRAGNATTRQMATVLEHSSCKHERSAAKAELHSSAEAGDEEAATYLERLG